MALPKMFFSDLEIVNDGIQLTSSDDSFTVVWRDCAKLKHNKWSNRLTIKKHNSRKFVIEGKANREICAYINRIKLYTHLTAKTSNMIGFFSQHYYFNDIRDVDKANWNNLSQKTVDEYESTVIVSKGTLA